MTSVSKSLTGGADASPANRARAYSKEELDSLRREGEHLLRVGGDAVARERSNTSPMLYFGSGSDGAGQDHDEDADSDLVASPTVGNSPERVVADELQDGKLHTVEPARTGSNSSNDSIGHSRPRAGSCSSSHSESSDSDSDSDGNGVSLEAEGEETYISTDFDFVDFNPDTDFHTARQLLTKSIWAPFGVSELASAIIEQVEVGTVVKVNGESVCGFATIMNMNAKPIAGASKKIREFLLRGCPEENGVKKKMASVLAAGESGSTMTGYYITEQMVNVPNEMAPALQRCVLDDLEWAVGSQNTGMTKEKKAELNFKYVIMVSPVFVVNRGGSNSTRDAGAFGALVGGGKKKKRQKKKQRTDASRGSSEQVYYVKYQDEILRDFAVLSYTTSLPKGGGRVPRQMGRFGNEKALVMLLETSQLSRSAQRLEEAIRQ